MVEPFRRRHHRRSVARGIPPHLTLLYPFVAAAELDAPALDRATALARAWVAFDGQLVSVGHFDDVVWLAPEPRDRFVRLLSETWDRFPQLPPYGRRDLPPRPHVTIAAADDGAATEALAELAAAELGGSLPSRFRADAATILAEDVDGTWAAAHRLPFGGA